MSGIHDLGGIRGFGSVVVDPDEPVFREQWEGRLFGLEMAIVSTGVVARVDELRAQLESIPPDVYLSTSYYARWALAVEGILVSRGVLSADEIDARVEEGERSGAGPSSTEQAAATAEVASVGQPTAQAVDRAPLFAPGDEVVARKVNPAGHTRLARYVRGRRGAIERRYGAYPLPEPAARGVIVPEYVYAVRFAADELWGETAEPNVSVCIDLFEPYLVAA